MSTLELVEALFDYRAELLLWVVGSIALYGIASNLQHLLRSRPSGRIGHLLTTFERWPHSFWFFEGLRFLYYLCVPYLALTRGVTSPSLMGMWAADWFHVRWFEEIGLGLVLGLGTLVLLLLSWGHYVRATAQIGYERGRKPFPAAVRMLLTPWGWGLIVLEVLYLELHWAFYRSATIRLVGDYYGVFLGFLLILAEWFLNPQIRQKLDTAHLGGETISIAVIAFSMTIIYYFTSNLWLCIAVHLAIQFALLSVLAILCPLANHKRQSN